MEPEKEIAELSELVPEGWALVKKDEWVPAVSLREAENDRLIDLALTESGALSLKAARALLQIDRQGTVDPEELGEKIQQLKRENGFLFRQSGPSASGRSFTPKQTVDPEQLSDEEYYAMKRNHLI